MELPQRKPPQLTRPLFVILPWLLRVGLITSILVYLALESTRAQPLGDNALPVGLILLGIAAVSLLRSLVRFSTDRNMTVLGVGFDSLAVSSGLYFGGEQMSALYVVYFLSTFTYGYQHGVTTLFIGTGFNALGFAFVITQQVYWLDHVALALGLLTALIVLPLYFAWMVRKSVLTHLSANEAGTLANWHSYTARFVVPLRGIIDFSEQLLSSPLNREQRGYARTVSAAAAHLMASVQKRMGTQRPAAKNLQVIDYDLHQVLRNTSRLMNGTEPKMTGRRFSYQIGELVPFRIKGDAIALQRVLIDLSSELLDSGPIPCVEITVDLSKPPKDSEGIWLKFNVSANQGFADGGSSNAPRAPTKAAERDPQPHQITARFEAETTSRLVETLGGQLLSSMDEQGYTTYEVRAPVAHPSAGTDRIETRTLRKTRAMVIGSDLNGRTRAFQLLLGWGASVTQRDSIALAFADLMQGATRGQGYHLIVVDSRGINADANTIATIVKQEPQLSAITLILLVPQHFSADRKARSRRAGYAAVLETPLDKTLLFNALHTVDRFETRKQNGVVRLIDRYSATQQVMAPLEILVAVETIAEQAAMKAMLEQFGHQVCTVDNGSLAVEALNNHHFDVAFVDFDMPDIEGLEMLHLYFSSRTDNHADLTPIIVLTNEDSEFTRNRCIEAGAHEVLPKPVRKHELLAVTGTASVHKPGQTLTQKQPLEQSTNKRASSVAILDQETLNELELLGSGISFVAELVASFLQDGEYLLKRMATAQQQTQTQIFRDIAYALKGSAGSVGAKELFQVASEACTLRGKQFEHSSAQLVADLNSAFQAARIALLAYIDDRKSQTSQ